MVKTPGALNYKHDMENTENILELFLGLTFYGLWLKFPNRYIASTQMALFKNPWPNKTIQKPCTNLWVLNF